jgi:hypothetical protein
LRDCAVVITSITDAPIPWTRCRAPATERGGSGLWLGGDLGEAVRRESAAPKAVKDREWTDEERAARRRLNAELNLGRNLRLGYRGPRWTRPNWTCWAGPDETVAARTGRTANGARHSDAAGLPTARDRRRRAAGPVQSPAP